LSGYPNAEQYKRNCEHRFENQFRRILGVLERAHGEPDYEGHTDGRKNDIRRILQDLTHG
jgi:hypothetical protein